MGLYLKFVETKAWWVKESKTTIDILRTRKTFKSNWMKLIIELGVWSRLNGNKKKKVQKNQWQIQ